MDAAVLRDVLKAVREGLSTEIFYQSMSAQKPSPEWRRITPHALGDDGMRWHVRAFCHVDHKFKDFILSRCMETLVHNHELDRTVALKVVLDLSDEQGAEGLPLNAGLAIGEPEFAELPVRYLVGESEQHRDYAIVQEVGLEVGIRWSALEQAPYVARLAIEMDGQPLATIVSPPAEGRAQLTDFNFAHPLLRRAVLPDDMPDGADEDFAAASPLEDEIRSLGCSYSSRWPYRSILRTRCPISPSDSENRSVKPERPGSLHDVCAAACLPMAHY